MFEKISRSESILKDYEEHVKAFDQKGRPQNINQKERDLNKHVPKFISGIRNAVRFKLPDNGELLDCGDLTSKAMLNKFIGCELNLPYPMIAIELDIQMYEYGRLTKYILPYVAVLEQKGDFITITDHVITASGAMTLSHDHVRIDRRSYEYYTNEEALYKSGKMEEQLPRFKVITQFLCALACTNIKPADEGEVEKEQTQELRMAGKKAKPSVKDILNRNKKKPKLTFKVLVIDTNKPQAVSKESNGGNGRTSPRIHLRRGHIRRLKTRNVWVNNCVVGSKSQGMVFKDYAVI